MRTRACCACRAGASLAAALRAPARASAASPGRCPTTSPTPRARFDPRRPRARATQPGGWQQLQWNFVGPFGVNAPEAWANVAADGAPGGAGVIVAVLDTGVAYANRGRFRRSPDFSRYQFVAGL